MPYEARWLKTKRVILERLYGNVTLDEVRHVNHELMSLYEQGIAPIHLICDLTGIETYPTGVADVRHTNNSLMTKDTGWVIIVTSDNPAIRFAAMAVSHVILVGVAQFRIFETFEPALAFLKEQEPDIFKK